MDDLVVSDLHATPDELGDVGALMGLIVSSIEQERPKRLVFLGDLHHTFAVTNVKVMGFYREWFKTLSRMCDVVAIVGNHDMPGTGAQTPHALLAYEDLIMIVDRPVVFDYTLYLPYYADPNLFHGAVEQAAGFEKIYCHQEFNGAMYDNGFFAPHGADPSLMDVPTISGHIHTPQKLGQVWYPGAPRWRTTSDANIDRSIYRINTQGKATGQIDTGGTCKRIWSTKIIEGGEDVVAPPYNDRDQFRFHVEGTASYVQITSDDIRKNYKNPRISSVIKDKRIRVRESDGIDVAFKKYATNFKAKNATPPALLMEKASQLFQRA
jgi:hypothetical protein